MRVNGVVITDPRQKARAQIGLSVMILAISLVVALFSLGDRVKDHEVIVPGTVVATSEWSERDHDSGRMRWYCQPTAEYELDGSTYQAQTRGGHRSCPWGRGSMVDVAVDPADPHTARIHVPEDGSSLLLFVFPAVGVALAAFGVRDLRRAGRPPQEDSAEESSLEPSHPGA